MMNWLLFVGVIVLVSTQKLPPNVQVLDVVCFGGKRYINQQVGLTHAGVVDVHVSNVFFEILSLQMMIIAEILRYWILLLIMGQYVIAH